MLRQDVVTAAAAGEFQIWPIETVDQALSLLTGLPVGRPDGEGRYPAGTVNQRVAERLWEMVQLRQKFNAEGMTEKPK
jgi:predicted ATP-dependent protease